MSGTTTRTDVVPAALDGERVDRVVAMLAGVARSEADRLVRAGAVQVDGRPATVRSRPVRQGQVVAVHLPEAPVPAGLEADPSVDVPVVHVDEHVLVVDKPPGMVVHPGAGRTTGTLVQGLLARFPELGAVGDRARPGVVHRLDKGTSGLLVVARTPEAHADLVGQLARRTMSRRYLALVRGHLEGEGLVDAPLGRGDRDRTAIAVSTRGRPARTRYRVLETFDRPAPATLLLCQLETGRTHQVRVHLAAIGHPVVGDLRYGGPRPVLPVGRPFLHAHQLGFDDPATRERREFESPLPEDLEALRRELA